MSFNFKYKTYDTSSGFGNPEEWRAILDALAKTIFGNDDFYFSKFDFFQFKDEFSEKYGGYNNKIKIPSKNKGYFSDCNTKEELKSKFRKLMMEYHPDKAGEQSTEKCKEIIEAYELKLKRLK